jgi:hypothetical protein
MADLNGNTITEDFYHATGCVDIETTFSALKVLWLKQCGPIRSLDARGGNLYS